MRAKGVKPKCMTCLADIKMKFAKITDNVSDTYYINIDNVAYLKEGFGTAKAKPIYKIVLMNGKHILIPSASDFVRIKNELYGE